MPEPNYLALYSLPSEPPKKSPVIKVSCGIGDTDGFPAFDVDSDVYATKDDSRWGFLITGGADFHMPLTVFQVTPDSLADKGGIRLGDVILEINEEDSTNYTLTEAHEKINATPKKIHFLVKSMEEDPMEEYEVGEEKSIVLRIPKPLPPPKVASIEKRLRDMQRKLSEIAEIPKILSSTLATVSQTFDKLAINGPTSHTNYTGNGQYQQQQKRKMSYDEDAYDYELSDDDDDDDCGGDDDDDDDADAGADDGGSDDQFNAKEAYLRLRQHIARQRKSKDDTPESDYASENNYPLNGDDNDNLSQSEDDEIDEDEAADNMQQFDNDKALEEVDEPNTYNDTCQQINLKLFLTPSGHNNKSDYKTKRKDEHVHVADVKDDDDEDDFLTTTFTMNLRNKPKLQINGNNLIDPTPKIEAESHFASNNGVSATDATQQSPASPSCASSESNQQLPEEWLQKQTKLDKFWPWADREKIIYKQSTCHLVPKKPLGLIGQRIQLLAKRNLLEHLNPATKSNK